MKHSFRHRSWLAVAAVLAAGAVSAAPMTYYGQDIDAAGSFVPDGVAVAARDSFLAALVPGTQRIDPLETATLTPAGQAALFGGDATLVVTSGATGAPAGSFTNLTGAGRFNTSPTDGDPACGNDCQWWEAFGDFTITFSQATRAFGFFGTDFSDFDGLLDLYLIGADGTEVQVAVPTGVPDPVTGERAADVDGSLIFFGVTDAARYFTAVRFDIQQAAGSTDAFGFDDFVIGALDADEPGEPNPVPEPATLALAGLALAGLAATRRRRRG